MGICHILSTNVLQKSPLVTNASEKVTTVASVSQNLYLPCTATVEGGCSRWLLGGVIQSWVSLLEVTTEHLTEDSDVTYLSAIMSVNDSCWTVNFEINGQHMTFKLDTQAEVTVIPESNFTKLGNVKLSPVTKSLCGPDRKPLDVTGRLKATLSSKNHTCDHEVYVIKDLKHNLLDLPAIKQLQLLKQIDHIDLHHSSIINKYPKLFSSLGTFKKDFEITIRPICNLYTLQGFTTTSSESAE